VQNLLTGCYINLDRCPERAAFMEAQLARLGLGQAIVRHAAVDGAQLPPAPASPLLPGERACFLSHLQVLERAAPEGFTLVLEDDAELSEQLPELVAKAIDGPLDGVDIAFLECQPHFTPAHLAALWEVACRLLPAASTDMDAPRRAAGVELLDARQFFKWGTSAYLVSPAGRTRLIALIRHWLREGPLLPVDRCYERALVAGELRGVITVPFLATTGLQWHGQSTIGNGGRMPSHASMVLRRLLYAGSLRAAEGMAQALAAAPVDPALQMYGLAQREAAALQRHEARARAGRP
jgi:GR25 family glycosyltransferase involved in LPS biosynthesis